VFQDTVLLLPRFVHSCLPWTSASSVWSLPLTAAILFMLFILSLSVFPLLRLSRGAVTVSDEPVATDGIVKRHVRRAYAWLLTVYHTAAVWDLVVCTCLICCGVL